jgi:hypothetical protein
MKHLGETLDVAVVTWARIELKGGTARWCLALPAKFFGVNFLCCAQPFEAETRVEYFNADMIFRISPHSETRVREELAKLDNTRAARNTKGEKT